MLGDWKARAEAEEEMLEAIPARGETPEEAFERRWYAKVLEEAMRRTRDDFVGSGKTGHWEAFEARELLPSAKQMRPTPYAELAVRLGFRTAADCAAAVDYLKGRLELRIREVLAETLEDPEEVEREYARMKEMLA